MKLIITGGGTGGHLYPALSIAHGVMERIPRARVLYVGSERGLESCVLPTTTIPFEALRVEGLVGRRPLRLLRSMGLLARSMMRARRLLREFGPDLVVGTGGYVSVPVVLTAQLMRIPTIIQEQNIYPGVANRWLSRLAESILLPSQEASRGFPRNTRHKQLVTGNPVRSDIGSISPEQARQALGVASSEHLALIVGGSGGAARINQGALAFINEYLEDWPGLRVILITGPRYYQDVIARIGTVSNRASILPYAKNMPELLAASDLLVSRAGAMMIAEATAVGLPLILVPSPNVTHDHQRQNACALALAEAAEWVEDGEFSGHWLACKLSSLLGEPGKLQQMAKASRRWGSSDALATILCHLVSKWKARGGSIHGACPL